jgi:hypothetical protein
MNMDIATGLVLSAVFSAVLSSIMPYIRQIVMIGIGLPLTIGMTHKAIKFFRNVAKV